MYALHVESCLVVMVVITILTAIAIAVAVLSPKLLRTLEWISVDALTTHLYYIILLLIIPHVVFLSIIRISIFSNRARLRMCSKASR
jgi:hypothetical protein